MGSWRIGAGAVMACMMMAACADTDPAGPEKPEVATLTVDAAEAWAYVAFDGEEAVPVTVDDRSGSEAWDLGFFATSVMLNGGAAGPGGVVGHCVCQNAGAADEAITAMTAESELADFEAVTAAQIPVEDEAWTVDALAPAIDGWYRYDMSTHEVSAAPEQVWKVRTASGEAYAKFHVTAIEGAAREHAGRITIEFAVQPSAGSAFEATRVETVDVSGGAVYFDLESGAAVSADEAWDLWFEGYTIRVNGGVSGDGSAGASPAGAAFDAVADASDLMAGHYRGDAFGGVFDEHPWYRYNLEGRHQIWPTYDVYLVKRGESVYKVQLTGYYGPTGEARQVTFRYARLR
ncbi:MAG TPA: HmuY family protein [Longimicrobiales bacterium]